MGLTDALVHVMYVQSSPLNNRYILPAKRGKTTMRKKKIVECRCRSRVIDSFASGEYPSKAFPTPTHLDRRHESIRQRRLASRHFLPPENSEEIE